MALGSPPRKESRSRAGIYSNGRAGVAGRPRRDYKRQMGEDSAVAETSQVHLADLGATACLAAAVSSQALPGDMIGLAGLLGAGKTAFARALITARARAAGLAPPREVPSPTFTLVQTYSIGAEALSHFDLFRLDGPADCRELGFDDALAAGPILVEWPDRMGPLIPENRLDITFAFGKRAEARTALLSAHGDWVDRLDAVVAKFNLGMLK